MLVERTMGRLGGIIERINHVIAGLGDTPAEAEAESDLRDIQEDLRFVIRRMAAARKGVCDECGGPADGPDDAARVQCDCGTTVCSACCVAVGGESYCPTCAGERQGGGTDG